MDAEEEVEPQSGERSPKRPRVEAESAVEVAGEPAGVAVAAVDSVAVNGDEAEEGPAVDGATAVVTVRPPTSSRIPRPVGNPVASSSSSEVVT